MRVVLIGPRPPRNRVILFSVRCFILPSGHSGFRFVAVWAAYLVAVFIRKAAQRRGGIKGTAPAGPGIPHPYDKFIEQFLRHWKNFPEGIKIILIIPTNTYVRPHTGICISAAGRSLHGLRPLSVLRRSPGGRGSRAYRGILEQFNVKN